MIFLSLFFLVFSLITLLILGYCMITMSGGGYFLKPKTPPIPKPPPVKNML